ncbi:hypothetical protein J437_LFUL012633 [Ladona fulva]|uniref:Transposase Helix-turn-helix domain-containing protein n=1 Tax=Ladona fulva TaxID=123851 RepID=A0A8K0P441_LADFU|nr:hypothetical protein J437_LFUL012633 [Ladona fulva]
MDSDEEYEEAFDEAIGEVVICLSEELQEILHKSRVWVKDWVEDPLEYKRHLRMSVEQFNELLSLIEPEISKKDTVMRNAIPARQKLEVTLRYLASGDNFQSLALLFRIPATTISRFIPEVLKAIITALKKYIKVIYWRPVHVKTCLLVATTRSCDLSVDAPAATKLKHV